MGLGILDLRVSFLIWLVQTIHCDIDVDIWSSELLDKTHSQDDRVKREQDKADREV